MSITYSHGSALKRTQQREVVASLSLGIAICKAALRQESQVELPSSLHSGRTFVVADDCHMVAAPPLMVLPPTRWGAACAVARMFHRLQACGPDLHGRRLELQAVELALGETRGSEPEITGFHFLCHVWRVDHNRAVVNVRQDFSRFPWRQFRKGPTRAEFPRAPALEEWTNTRSCNSTCPRRRALFQFIARFAPR